MGQPPGSDDGRLERKNMIENKNELMLKMCASENGGIGVEVDGKFYFYEHFEDDTLSRIYRHFGMDHNFTFYSMKWAHESRIKELMELRNELFIACEAVRVENITILAAAYIAQWSGCTKEEAFRQVKGCKVHYSKIR